MEDTFSVAYTNESIPCGNSTNLGSMDDQEDVKIDTVSCLKFIYVGIFDGHGGKEAAQFTRQHLLNNITSNKLFWSEKDSDVLLSIREGFLTTHYAMLNELGKFGI